jgi:hypothetical protein
MRKILTIIALSLAFTVALKAQTEYSNLIFRNDSIFGFNNTTKAFEFISKRIPSPEGQSGKVLSNNGSAIQWVNPDAGTALAAYPVGSIYISVNSTNPSSLFGGTWVAFAAGRTLIGVDAGQTEFDTVEETGGAKSKTLIAAEMPAHSHTIPDVRSATTGAVNTLVARTADASSTAGNDVSTGSSGSGSAFSILNPYITVYIFKRTQ